MAFSYRLCKFFFSFAQHCCHFNPRAESLNSLGYFSLCAKCQSKHVQAFVCARRRLCGDVCAVGLITFNGHCKMQLPWHPTARVFLANWHTGWLFFLFFFFFGRTRMHAHMQTRTFKIECVCLHVRVALVWGAIVCCCHWAFHLNVTPAHTHARTAGLNLSAYLIAYWAAFHFSF